MLGVLWALLAESVTVKADAADGVAQAKFGSVETRIKLWKAPLAEAVEDIEGIWQGLYFGDNAPKIGSKIVAAAQTGLGKSERLDWSGFKEQVSIALRNGDEHDIPQVAEGGKDHAEKGL